MIAKPTLSAVGSESVLLSGKPLTKRLQMCSRASPSPRGPIMEMAVDVSGELVAVPQMFAKVNEDKDQPKCLVHIALPLMENCGLDWIEQRTGWIRSERAD